MLTLLLISNVVSVSLFVKLGIIIISQSFFWASNKIIQESAMQMQGIISIL